MDANRIISELKKNEKGSSTIVVVWAMPFVEPFTEVQYSLLYV